MAPLENGGFQPSVWAGDRSRPTDSLMRALLYVAQQVGRPLSEADVRRLAAVPAAGLDEAAFLTAGTRLGLDAQASRPHARAARLAAAALRAAGGLGTPLMSSWVGERASGWCSTSSTARSGI